MKKVKLSHVIEKPISGEWGEEGDTVAVIRTTNFTNEGRIDFSNVVHRDIDRKKIDAKKLRIGDVIIEKSGGSPTQPVGRVIYFEAEGEYLCNNFTAVLRPKSDQLLGKYLLYMLYAAHQTGLTREYQNKTTGIINLQLQKYIDNFEIPLPPLSEQKRIASLLDAADHLRQQDKALIGEYNLLAQSVFLEMFGDPVRNERGWEEVLFEEIGTLDRGVSKFRPRNAPELLNGPYPLVQTGDVANAGTFLREFKSTYSAIGLKQSKMWPRGTLCITIAANIAKTAILDFDACFPDSVVGFLPNEKTNVSYVFYWIGFLQKILEDSAPESAQKNINLRILRELSVPLPPLSLQQKFAEVIGNIELQKGLAARNLAESEALFAGLLQTAFKG
jgi:type I restriction enzyme S subunit